MKKKSNTGRWILLWLLVSLLMWAGCFQAIRCTMRVTDTQEATNVKRAIRDVYRLPRTNVSPSKSSTSLTREQMIDMSVEQSIEDFLESEENNK